MTGPATGVASSSQVFAPSNEESVPVPEGTPPPPPPTRVYRAHLDLPPAVIIRSSPGPSRSANLALSQSYITHPHDTPSSGNSSSTALYASLPKEAAWKEWHINPAKHGPERMKRPPVFLPSQSRYDELGRSVVDGVGVEVSEGKGKGKEREREGEPNREDGEGVAGWYLALAKSTSASAGPSGSTTPNVARDTMVPLSNIDTPIVVDDDDDEAGLVDDAAPIAVPSEAKATSTSASASASASASSISQSSKATNLPIRIHRKEWFIRRALASASAAAAAASQSTSEPVKPKPKPTAIGSMLNIPSNPVPRLKAPTYVLGPENKGYEILRQRLGWEGGGLGRPEGWAEHAEPMEEGRPSHSFSAPSIKAEGSDTGTENGGVGVVAGVREGQGQGQGGRDVVDLTADTDTESADSEEEEEPKPGGPGRTAPIPTTLKLDRLGLGHKRSRALEGTGARAESTRKKVTHTHAEILQAQKRGRYTVREAGGAELGKKGKIKWRDKDRREREARRRLAAALNA